MLYEAWKMNDNELEETQREVEEEIARRGSISRGVHKIIKLLQGALKKAFDKTFITYNILS